MKTIDVAAIRTDAFARLRFLEEFVGFSEDDWRALSESVEVVGPKLPAILDALYEHLLSFDDTKRVFLGAHGEVDPQYIAIRKEHLTEWVLATVGGGDRQAFAKYLMNVGRRHTGVAGEPNRVVPPRYLVALTGFIQSALLATIFDALPHDAPLAKRLSLAWNKMLVIQLEIFLKAACPQWDDT